MPLLELEPVAGNVTWSGKVAGGGRVVVVAATTVVVVVVAYSLADRSVAHTWRAILGTEKEGHA